MGILIGFVIIFSMFDNYTSFAQTVNSSITNSTNQNAINSSMVYDHLRVISKSDPKLKFESDFIKKINEMKNAGETRNYDVIIFVKKMAEKGLDAKSVAKLNKDKLEQILEINHHATNVQKTNTLSFVIASIPLNEIEKIADYDFVAGIGDGELKTEPLSANMNDAKFNIDALNLSYDGRGVIVAVIDTGIRQSPQDQNHPDLPVGTKIIKQTLCDFSGCNQHPNNSYSDILNHGTHNAGIIAGLGNADGTMKGIASGALLLNAKTLDSSGMVFALDWSIGNGAKVANISLKESDQCNSVSMVQLAVDESVDEGLTVVTAAGNNGPHQKTIVSPACAFNTITVGAINDKNTRTTSDDTLWNDTPRGYASSKGTAFDGRLKPDLVAPGVLINSTDHCTLYNNTNYWNGTSCQSTPVLDSNGFIENITGTSHAAPFVSGAVALVLQAHPEYTPAMIKTALLVGANWTWNPNPLLRNPINITAADYEKNSNSYNDTLSASGFGLLDVNKTLTYANAGGHILQGIIGRYNHKDYSFNATAGDQVKVILSWLKHPNGNITNPTDIVPMNLDFTIKRPDGAIAYVSNSTNQTNEFAVFVAPLSGAYKITVSSSAKSPLQGGQSLSDNFALASTHTLRETYQVKQGIFTKALVGSTQIGRPTSDMVVGGWTPTPLYQQLNETVPNDSTLVTSPSGTAPSFQVKLSSLTNPQTTSGLVIRFRAESPGGSGAAEQANAELFQGSTLIAQTGLQSLSRTTFTEINHTLTSAEANSITDYTNLNIKIVTSKGSNEVIKVSWMQFDVPSPPPVQSISGIGFKPKALLIFTTGQTSQGTTDGYNFAIGYSDGVRSRSIGMASDDNVTPSKDGRAFGAKVIKILGSGTPTIAAEADIVSFNADGFTLKWTTDDSNPTIIHYIALGGDDLTNVKVSSFAANKVNGNQAVTGLGFSPDLIMFMHAASTSDNSTASNSYLGLGFGGTGGIGSRGAIAVEGINGKSPTSTWRAERTDKALVALNPATGAVSGEADMVSMDTDGFTINWTTHLSSTDRIYYLALRGGNYFADNVFQKPTDVAPVIQSVTFNGNGFQPRELLLWSYNDLVNPGSEVNNRLSFSAATDFSQGVAWIGDSNNVSPTVTARSDMTSKIMRLATESAVGSNSSIDAESSLVSMDYTGFTLNWTKNNPVAEDIMSTSIGISPDPTRINLNRDMIQLWGNPVITSIANHVYAFWSEQQVGQTGSDIYFKKSDDSGTTFGSKINISNDAADSVIPLTASSGNNVYIIWEEPGSSPRDIFFKPSNNNGTSFGSTINLSNNAGDSGVPNIVASGNNVYVAWSDSTSGSQILFKRSTDGGTTFNGPVQISTSGVQEADSASIAVLGSTVYVAWHEGPTNNDQIKLRKSTDNGNTFGSTMTLSNSPTAAIRPAIVAIDNNVYVAWLDYDSASNIHIFFKASHNNGNSFGSATDLDISNQGLVSIASTGKNVYVGWSHQNVGVNTGYDEIVKRSNDNGTTFTIAINSTNGESFFDQIFAQGNNVYALDITGHDAFIRISNDNGTTFVTLPNLSNTGLSTITNEAMAVSGNHSYLISSTSGGSGGIYFKKIQ